MRRLTGNQPSGGIAMCAGIQRVLAIMLATAYVPCVFLTICVGCARLDQVRGSTEVSQFINVHRGIVARRLADPRVHSFSLSHAPNTPWILMIAFDVDDKATYRRIEEDMDKAWQLRFPAMWNTKLRSNEDLGNEWGFAGQGLAMAGQGMIRMLIATAVSIAVPLTVLILTLRRIRMREGENRSEPMRRDSAGR